MPCYHPISARFVERNGKKQLYFSAASCPFPCYNDLPKIEVPCGKCIGCRLERSRQWAVRCIHEASLHEANCFVTLTYDDKHLPEHKSLVREHPQLFFKRLRARGIKIRFFGCGEYGSRYERPHYHAIIFGHDFHDDLVPLSSFSSASSTKLYTSRFLSELWPYGFNSVGTATFESACYVARYCTKKLNGELGRLAYEEQDRISPFLMVSNRPGIGQGWYDKYGSDVFPRDSVLVRGHLCKPPRYYEKKLEMQDKLLYDIVKGSRELNARTLSPDRLLALEELCLLRFDKVSRALD